MAGFLSASNGERIKGEVSILHVFIPFITHLEMPDPEWPAIVHPGLSRRNSMKADRLASSEL